MWNFWPTLHGSDHFLTTYAWGTAVFDNLHMGTRWESRQKLQSCLVGSAHVSMKLQTHRAEANRHRHFFGVTGQGHFWPKCSRSSAMFDKNAGWLLKLHSNLNLPIAKWRDKKLFSPGVNLGANQKLYLKNFNLMVHPWGTPYWCSFLQASEWVKNNVEFLLPFFGSCILFQMRTLLPCSK